VPHKIERVALISLGPSKTDYLESCLESCYQDVGTEWDEVWTVNAGLRAFNHDRVFIMDDLRVQAQRYPKYAKWLKAHKKPIVTSTAYKEFPTSETYPIEEVLHLVGEDAWFPNTIVYVIAYALLKGVKSLYLYGADFQYASLVHREEGSQAAAYLIGMAKVLGMTTILSPETTLLSPRGIKVIDGHSYRPLYGYMKHPTIKRDSAALQIQKDQECRQGVQPADRHVKQEKGLTFIEPDLGALLERQKLL